MSCYYHGIYGDPVAGFHLHFYRELLELYEDIQITKQYTNHKIIRWWLAIDRRENNKIYTDRLQEFDMCIRQDWLCFALPSLVDKQRIYVSEVRQNIPPKLMNCYYWKYAPFAGWYLIYEISKS